VRRSLTEDQRPQPPARAKGPSDYQQRKQREAAQRKLAGQIKRSEEQQTAYRTEKQTLEAEMAADPTVWTRELSARCDELGRLLRDEERRWIELNEQLESAKPDPQ